MTHPLPEPLESYLRDTIAPPFLGTRERITRVATATGYELPYPVGHLNDLIADTEDDHEYVKDVKLVSVGDGLVAFVVYAISEAITDETP